MRTGIKDRGFTLMEVLISLALLTVVLGAVYSSFFFIQRALEHFDGVSLKYHEARTALDMMRREVESAVLKMPRNRDEESGTPFTIKDRDIFGKKASTLDLTALSFRRGKAETVSYFVNGEKGELELFKTVTPVTRSGGYTVGIMEGISGFSVETLYNSKWVGTWDAFETGRLPEVIRLSITFDDNGRAVTLTEYAHPMTGRTL